MNVGQFLNIEPWWRFGVALLIGSLIGLEREFIQQHLKEPDFAGIRTFALIALLGALSAFLSQELGVLTPALVAFGGLILLVVSSYVGALLRTRAEEGITTEVAAMLVFLLGGLTFWEPVEVAGALAVIVALLLSMKGRLHEAIRRMSREDLRVALEFGLVSAVILPLLPNRTLDPLNVLNPFQIWLLVVFVSGIGFAGYVLIKALGAERGTGLAAILGGIVSSTATTISFAGRSKTSPQLSRVFSMAIILASGVMFPRVWFEVLVIHRPLIRLISLPLGLMLAASLLMVWLFWRQRHSDQHLTDHDQEAVKVANPLKLSTAITFGLVFAIVLVAVKVAQLLLGTTGVYIAALISGLADVDAITLSVSKLASTGQLPDQVAATAIAIAALMNTLSKAIIAYVVGTVDLRRVVLRPFAIILIAGAVGGGVMLLLF